MDNFDKKHQRINQWIQSNSRTVHDQNSLQECGFSPSSSNNNNDKLETCGWDEEDKFDQFSSVSAQIRVDTPSISTSSPPFSNLSGGGVGGCFYQEQVKKFRKIFDEIPSFEHQDLDSLKMFILVLAQAIKQLSVPFLAKNFGQLRIEAFGHAVEKLPRVLRELYLKQYRDNSPASKRTLLTLLNFLKFKIIEDTRAMQQHQQVPSSSSPPNTSSCRYCKTEGHRVADCPQVKKLLCFRCFQLGHKEQLCPNEPFFGLNFKLVHGGNFKKQTFE